VPGQIEDMLTMAAPDLALKFRAENLAYTSLIALSLHPTRMCLMCSCQNWLAQTRAQSIEPVLIFGLLALSRWLCIILLCACLLSGTFQLRPSFAWKTCFLKALAPVSGFSSGSRNFCKAASIFTCTSHPLSSMTALFSATHILK